MIYCEGLCIETNYYPDGKCGGDCETVGSWLKLGLDGRRIWFRNDGPVKYVGIFRFFHTRFARWIRTRITPGRTKHHTVTVTAHRTLLFRQKITIISQLFGKVR